MKQQLLPGTGHVGSNLELTLINTKELLELKEQKLKELQSVLRDKENEILFLKEVLSARIHFIRHQNNCITSLQMKLSQQGKTNSPVIEMKTYLHDIGEEQLNETAI